MPTPSDDHDPALTTREAAELLGISVSTAQKWIEGGAVESWKTPGGHRRMRRTAVLRLLEERTALARPAAAVAEELLPLQDPAYPVPADETSRLRAVGRTGLLDTEPDPAFDRLTRLAAIMAGTSASVVSVLTARRQWYKSRHGVETTETPRDLAFCNHVLLADDMVMVEDARGDARFRDNPLVRGEPHIRFYAGCPLHSPDGFVIGTLCVFDTAPRRLDAIQQECLRALAEIGEDAIRLHMAERGRR